MTGPVVVTGSRGLLGSSLLRTIPGAHALSADIRDEEAVEREVAAVAPEWILHAAAKTDVAACELDPEDAFAVNAKGTKHIVDVARRQGSRVIYVSTVSVFSGDTGEYSEEDTPAPGNTYAKSKREGEVYARSYDAATVLRLNLIGIHAGGSRGKNFMEWLVDSVKRDADLTLFSDARVNPLSDHSIAEYIQKLIEKQTNEHVLHIGSRDVLSKAEIGRLVLAHFPNYAGVVTETSIDTLNDGAGRPKESWLDTSRAEVLFGPMPGIEEEIRRILGSGA